MRAWIWVLAGLLGTWACSSDGDDDDASAPSAGSGGNAGSVASDSGTSIGPSAGSGGSGGTTQHDGGVTVDVGTRCGPIVSTPRCLANGWCWYAPVPIGGDLNAIDGVPDGSSVFAVGDYGIAFRKCEGHWFPIETGAETDLLGVWHPSADFAVAVGAEGTVLRWDGDAWTKLPPPTDATLRAVWGESPDKVWIGGDADGEKLMLQLSGTTFTNVELPMQALNGGSVRAITGKSPEVFAAGGPLGGMDSWRFDGSAWTFTLTGTDGVVSDLQQYEDGPLLALVPGINGDIVYKWVGPTDQMPGRWDVTFGMLVDGHRMFSLLETANGQPGVVVNSNDFALPGLVFAFDGSAWTETEERMRVGPRAVWTGSREGYAVGAATSLLARGQNAIWSLHDEVETIAGGPVYLGGPSEQALVLVTEHVIARRDDRGWREVARDDNALFTAASIDEQGRVYVGVRGESFGATDEVRYYDDTGWHTLPEVPHLTEVLGIAPDDVWVMSSEILHFDGSSWVRLYDLCRMSGSTPRRLRRAPDGHVWIMDSNGAIEIDGSTCTRHLAPIALTDIVWNDDGSVWASATWGELFELQGEELVMRADLLPTDNGPDYVQRLFAGSNGTLRVAFTGEGLLGSERKLVTVDLGATPTAREPIPMLETGRFWASGDVVLQAISGGVLRRVDE